MPPLNDQEITEIKTAIETGAELPAHLKPLSDLGLNIRTPKMEEEFKTNYENTVISPKIANIHNLYEKDILEITGIKKNPNEKSYDYLKRSVPEKLGVLQSELKTLKEKGSAGQSDADKTRIAQLEAIVSEKDGEITKLKTSGQERTVSHEIDKSIAKIEAKFKKDMSPTALKDLIEARRASLLKASRINDAGIHFIDSTTGQPAISKATAKLLTVDEIVTESFKDIVDVEKKAEGAGTKGGAAGAGSGGGITDPKTLVKPDEVKTKTDLTVWLKKEGLTHDHKEYNATFDRLSVGLPLR